ncbi:MAG TPA: DoxX family protein [Anaerolineae bacterium]|nr:DoxX family protein [Anaerolineae bacterium]
MVSVDLGLLGIRLVVGLVIAAHGAQKLFGWFGGKGLAGSQGMMTHLHLEPAWFWGFVSAINEFGGGILTALGLLMPLGPLMILANMLVAITLVHWKNGFWNEKRGIEFPLTLGLVGISLGLTGAGAYSLDAYLPFALPEPITLVVGLIAVLVGVGITFVLSHRVLAPQQPLPRPR